MNAIWKGGGEPCRVTDTGRKVKMEEFTVEPRRQTAAGLFSSYLNPGDSIVMNTARWSGHPQRVRQAESETAPLLCRQLAAMLTAGVPLSRALEVSAGSGQG